ncbi:MAG: hypothetical protein IKN15_03025 [Bacteroidaceae bacterium]|nr:hypothetical protein [Bacteroidaceae bacterium]
MRCAKQPFTKGNFIGATDISARITLCHFTTSSHGMDTHTVWCATCDLAPFAATLKRKDCLDPATGLEPVTTSFAD